MSDGHASPEAPSEGGERRATPRTCVILAALVVAALHLLERRVGFSVMDEGYLWYGVQALLRGELPLRDFNSYDPGRFLWCAGWGLLFGPGILALRLSCALFAVVGLSFGLLTAARVVDRRVGLPLAALVLALFMQPSWKVFESSVAMIAVWFATRLVERPSPARHLAAGICAGAAAFVGRNHGVYVSVGMLLLITLVALRSEPRVLPRRLVSWGLGVLVGYAPMLALIAFAPGYPNAFVESLGYFAGQGLLSGKKPVPWPWTVDYASMGAWGGVHNFSVGVAFLLLPLYYLPSLLVLARTGARDFARRAPWMAATAIGVVYVHHASVHAAYYHLCQAYAPLLLGVMALPAVFGAARPRVARVASLGLLLVLAVGANVTGLQSLQRLRLAGTPVAMVPHAVGGDELYLRGGQAQTLGLLEQAVRENVPADEPVFLAPTFPGLYCMLGRAAPTWDVYMAWMSTEASQARLVRQLADVDWALVADVQPAGEEWLRLSNTNPEAWELLQREFEVLPLEQAMPFKHLLLRRRR